MMVFQKPLAQKPLAKSSKRDRLVFSFVGCR
jgi:hypothetical protein